MDKNNIQKKITGLNVEILFLNERLKAFKKSTNAVDINVGKRLLELVNTINSFLENSELKFIEYPNDNVTDIEFDLHQHQIEIQRSFSCGYCQKQIAGRKEAIENHIISDKHQLLFHKGSKRKEIDGHLTKKKKCISSESLNSTDCRKPQRNYSPALSDTSNVTNNTNRKAESLIQKLDQQKIISRLPSLQLSYTVENQQRKKQGPDTNISKPSRTRMKNKKGFKEKLCWETKKCLNEKSDDLEKYAIEILNEGKALTDSPGYRKITRDIKMLLQVKYPKIKTYLFGSRMIGLGTKGSDLDIFIDIDNSYESKTKPDKNRMFDLIKELEKLLKNYNYWDDIAVVDARTPIIRVYHKNEKIDCDLTFSNGLSHRNTMLLKYFVDLQPVCAQLCAYLKLWARKSLFPKMSSYTLTLLVIFYLQTEKVLPSVATLQEGVESKLIYHWESAFQDKTLKELKIEKCSNFRKHILGFFEFYGRKFSFDEFVVCPFIGYALKKKDFNRPLPELKKILPKEMIRYTNHLESILNSDTAIDKTEVLFAYDRDMVVQDPMDLAHNVSKGIKTTIVSKFVGYCALSFDEIEYNSFAPSYIDADIC